MIISIDADKACDKIQHPFMIKTLQKMGIEGTYLNLVKAIYDKTIATLVSMVKTESIPPKIKNKTRVPTFTTIIQHSSGSPDTAIREEKEIKGIQIRKEEVRLSLFADDMILYIENPKDSIIELQELISEFSKVTGYKINTQKSLAFLYINNEKSIPFTTETKRIKYLGINLPKETKELYTENDKKLIKRSKMNK